MDRLTLLAAAHGPPLYGTTAKIPPAGAVSLGTFYLAVDGNVRTLFRTSGLSPSWSKCSRSWLTAAQTYYVRTDGNDSNDGLTDTAAGAFLTLQKAIDTVAALDISTFAVTIQVAAGTYTGGVTVSGPWIGSGTVSLTGDTTTPANVIISTTSVDAIRVHNPASRLTVGGFKLQTTTSGHCIAARFGSFVTVSGKMDFGAAAAQFHLYATQHAHIAIAGLAYNITGGAAAHLYVDIMGSILSQSSSPTLTGTPAFSNQFAHADALGILFATGMTFSGSATGTRYLADTSAVINTAGGGANYFPGNAAGSTANDGVYV